MVGLRPHEGHASQTAQDIVDDVFDLGLIIAALAYDLLEVHIAGDVIPMLAMAGAASRAILRRVFRIAVGPKIQRWVKRTEDHVETPSSD